MIFGFMLVTSPTSCHALAQAARANGLEPKGIEPNANPTNE
jgi:multisubunit Na+/H+ antiporter MnhG subunit